MNELLYQIEANPLEQQLSFELMLNPDFLSFTNKFPDIQKINILVLKRYAEYFYKDQGELIVSGLTEQFCQRYMEGVIEIKLVKGMYSVYAKSKL